MPLMNWVEHEKEYRLGEHKLPYHFESNGHDDWIVDFINQLFQNVFDISLAMLENKNVREFPIAYSEEQTYSTIANAIGRLTPYHVSEIYLAKNKNDSKRRVDFRCQYIDEQAEIKDIWIECKDICFNLINKIIGDDLIKEISSAIKQIESIKIESNINEERYKIAFFNVYVYYGVGNKPDGLETITRNIYEEIEKQIQKAYENIEKEKQSQEAPYDIVYSVLDLCKTIKDGNINEEWTRINKNEDKKEKILKKLIEDNPYQIFLEPSIYQDDKKEQFMPYMMLVAVIEKFPKNDSGKS